MADDVCERLRPVLAQPPEAVLDRRMWFPDRVELVLEPREEVARGEERHAFVRNRVNLGELRRELEREARRWVSDDAAPDRLALDQLHREGLAAAELAEVRDRPRHLDTAAGSGLEHQELVLEREGLLVDDAAARAADEQTLIVHVHGPGLLRGTARHEAHVVDGPAEPLLELSGPRDVGHYA